MSFKDLAHFSQLLNVLILLMLVIMEDSNVWLSCSCVVPLAWRLCRALIWLAREWSHWKSSRVQFSKSPIYFQSVNNEEMRSLENKVCLQHFSVIFLTMMDRAWSGNMILCLQPALGTFYVLLLFMLTVSCLAKLCAAWLAPRLSLSCSLDTGNHLFCCLPNSWAILMCLVCEAVILTMQSTWQETTWS